MSQDPLAFPLPFLVRDHLRFEGAAVFDLEVRSQSDTASAVEITGLTREGLFRFNFTTGSTSALETRTFRIPDIPIMLSVRSLDVGNFPSTPYVVVYLRVNSTQVMLLCQGALGSVYGINWPNQAPVSGLQARGKTITALGTNPAAGANATLSVPAGEFWLLKSLQITLVTSATVATRRVRVIIDHAQSEGVEAISAATQAASLTVEYHMFVGAGVINDTDGNRQNSPLPAGMLLAPTTDITVTAANLQAGDDFDGIKAVIEKFYHVVSP